MNPANVKDLRIGVDSMQQQHSDNMSVTIEGNDEPNDEIQRLISNLHTFFCSFSNVFVLYAEFSRQNGHSEGLIYI